MSTTFLPTKGAWTGFGARRHPPPQRVVKIAQTDLRRHAALTGLREEDPRTERKNVPGLRIHDRVTIITGKCTAMFRSVSIITTRGKRKEVVGLRLIGEI